MRYSPKPMQRKSERNEFFKGAGLIILVCLVALMVAEGMLMP